MLKIKREDFIRVCHKVDYELENGIMLFEMDWNGGWKVERKLNILRSKEDGDLTLGYAGVDFKDYEYITVEGFIDIVEGLNLWDDIKPEIYEEVLKDVGLNYSDYSDPDIMWDDFLQKIK